MLVRQEENGVLAIGQLSHAWLSGQLARGSGNDRFPSPEPREEIALGAEQHDLGWALFDLRPGLSPASGLPRSFLETSVEEHLEIWRTAPDRMLSVSLHAALVVSLHGASLSALRLKGAEEGREALEEHVAAERARQAVLRSLLSLSEAETERIQRWMWTWDGLSLALCNGWDPFVARDVPSREGLEDVELRRIAPREGAPPMAEGGQAAAGGGLAAGERSEGVFSVDPWPFGVARLEVRCEARRLGIGPYEDEDLMERELAQAEPVRLVFVLEPSRG